MKMSEDPQYIGKICCF